jgi:hypothetical protein
LHRKRALDAKKRFDKDHKPSCVVPGTVVYRKRLRALKLGESTKLHRKYDGPYVVVSMEKGVVQMRHLHTGIYHPGRVNISQLKVPNFYEASDGNIIHNKKGVSEKFVNELPRPFYQIHNTDKLG